MLADDASAVVGAHVDTLTAQVRDLISGGVASGEFAADIDAGAVARSVMQATTRFHHPAFASQWADPAAGTDLEHLCDLLLDGLRRRSG